MKTLRAEDKIISNVKNIHMIGIGVSGTHGKTTVTSMITQILILNKCEPSAVIGGNFRLYFNGRLTF